MKPPVESGETVAETLCRGRVTFMEVELLAAPGALVARHETSLLGHTAEALLKERAARHGRQRVVDMCCGSGNLGCALAARLPEVHVHASDLTDGSVELARRNVAHLGLEERVSVHQGDLFDPLHREAEIAGQVDVIVCNPPYISTGKLEKERSHLLEREPREAFDGGPYGIAIHQRVVKDALHFLKPEGVLLFEVGLGQAKQVTILFNRARAYREVHTRADDSGEIRVVFSTRSP